MYYRLLCLNHSLNHTSFLLVYKYFMQYKKKKKNNWKATKYANALFRHIIAVYIPTNENNEIIG